MDGRVGMTGEPLLLPPLCLERQNIFMCKNTYKIKSPYFLANGVQALDLKKEKNFRYPEAKVLQSLY